MTGKHHRAGTFEPGEFRQAQEQFIATFTYTVTDPGGVDLSLFFPGLLPTRHSISVTKLAKLKAAAFYVGKKGHDGDDRIIYDKGTGALYYDPDGIGPAAQIKFAQLTKKLALKANDFFVI